MSSLVTRRTVLTTTSAAVLGGLISGPVRAAATDEAEPLAGGEAKLKIHPSYPSQDPKVVRTVVGSAHGKIDRVRELVSARPELANACIDWGFGDWETALGAASHMGRRDIADVLMEHGARPDIFTAAMLGNLEAVRGFVSLHQGIQRRLGPHGISLLAHAKAGGEPAAGVVAYLEELGDADQKYTDLSLSEAEKQIYIGMYRFGEGPDDRLEVLLNRRGQLAVRRGSNFSRALFYQGEHEFHPGGAPSARLRFTVEGGRARSFRVLNPGVLLTARRVGGD